MSILLADDTLVRTLNRRFRGVDEATNVLSFPALECAPGQPPRAAPGVPLPLGDVVLALQTTQAEAASIGKPLADHVSHLVVHGVLHLAGYDHESVAEARAMAGLEAAALRPYDAQR